MALPAVECGNDGAAAMQYDYRLTGVIVHQGRSISSGHYTSYGTHSMVD